MDDDTDDVGNLPTFPTPEPPGDPEIGEDAPLDLLYELEETLVELDLTDTPARISVDDSGRFEIHELLGRGAMGAVYRAYDKVLDRDIALKVVQLVAPEREHLQERLLQEARAMARLDHPNVVGVLDIKRARSGERVIALDYIDGPTVRSWQRGRSIGELLDAYTEIAHGLIEAHDGGVIHRDFKPDNALVRQGEESRVVVVDFGLAGGVVDDERTAEGLLSPIESTGLGTPEYMAPEQHWRPADARCDQYAYCVALWEAIAGERPFPKDRGSADKFPSVPARMPGWLYRILRKGLAWTPKERFVSMGALVRRLDRSRRVRAVSRWVVAALVVLTVLGGVALALQPPPCADASAPMEQLWSEEARSQLEQRLRAIDAPWSERAAEHALGTFDAAAARWSSEANGICEAELGSGRSAVLDRRRGCLEHWLAYFRTSVHTLSEGDAAAAAYVVDMLGPVAAGEDICRIPPPNLDDAIRTKLVEAETKEAMRSFEHALVDASAAVQLAGAASPCLEGGEHSFEAAAANYRLGHVLGKLERWSESRAALGLASQNALSCGDWWTAFDIRVFQSFADVRVRSVGLALAEARLDDVEAFISPSAGTPGPSTRRAEALRMRGLVLAAADQPRFEEAVAALSEARDMLDQLGASLDRRVRVRQNLGWAHQRSGLHGDAKDARTAHAGARAAYAEATQLLSEAVSAQHPQTEQSQALVDLNLGLIALEEGELDRADELFSAAAAHGDVVVVSKAYSSWVQSRTMAGEAKGSAPLLRRYGRWLSRHPSLADPLRAEALYTMGQLLTEASLREGGGLDSAEDFDEGLAWLREASVLWAASDLDKSLTVRVLMASMLYQAMRHDEALRLLDALPINEVPDSLQNNVREIRELVLIARER